MKRRASDRGAGETSARVKALGSGISGNNAKRAGPFILGKPWTIRRWVCSARAGHVGSHSLTAGSRMRYLHTAIWDLDYVSVWTHTSSSQFFFLPLFAVLEIRPHA